MIGHRIMGSALACTGSPVQAREHYDRALTMYDPLLIALSRCASKSTSALEYCFFARGPCGYSGIQRPRSQMFGRLSLTHMN